MASEDVTSLFGKLHLSSESNDGTLSQQFEELIDNIHKEGDPSTLCEQAVKEKIFAVIVKALQSDNTESQTKAAELVAELAKVESCRIACVEEGIVPILVEKMEIESTATALQACRALGNICYEYDGGRTCVINSGGAKQLLNLLKRAADLPDSPENHQLRLVATGFLLNLLNSYDTAEDHPMDSLLVEVLCHYLEKFATDEDIPTHILLSLSCIADSDLSRGLVVSRDITSHLVRILNVNESAEVVETCLELITNLAETDCVKTQFAAGGICEAVIGVINRHTQNPSPDLSPPIIKTAADLLILILVGDESVIHLYGNGEGIVYKELVNWLGSTFDELQIAGALAMGNFARNDSHCIKMVEHNIAEKLLQLLSRHNSPEGDIRLQHALLSALRNLSIAKQNKPIIVKQGALDIMLPMISTIETYPVVFKLLATLRMVIDGQKEAAIKLGLSTESITRIVSWCSTIEHPGVQGEASRIIAWIVKNCDGDDAVLQSISNAGSLLPLISMLASEHVVMVNEAVLALTLIFAKSMSESVVEVLKEANFMALMVAVLNNQMLPQEVLINILTCLNIVAKAEQFKELDKNGGLKTVLQNYVSHSVADVKDQAKKLIEMLEA